MLLHQSPEQAERSCNLSRSFSSIRDPHTPADANAGRLPSCLVAAIFLFTLSAMLLPAPVLIAQQLQGATVRGVVRDSAGTPVQSAHVVLQKKALKPREADTDGAGRFTFADVATGQYTLTASAGALRSEPAAVTVSRSGELPPIHLVLNGTGAQPSAQQNAGQAMQFADSPDFKIAAVTDWTAAGGHGSDANLRASEALTREAVKLGSDDKKLSASARHDIPSVPEGSESDLRAAAAKAPKSFEANSRLGGFYFRAGRYKEAIPPLRAAYRAAPANDENEWDLAQALNATGDAAQAREHVQHLLTRHPSADLHRTLGELDEKLGDPLSAVREFREAASEEPSEVNYFAWGSELLLHRAIWQAKEVFDEGVRLYPNSARMLTARGAALFAGALYDQAAQDLCRASDLNPASALPYDFIGKIEIAAPNPLPCVLSKLARFEELQPTNSLANYYYAMALWKQQDQARDPQAMARVKTMLVRAVTLAPQCADGYFQLGNLSAGQKQWQEAIKLYLKAIQANPDLSDAHYRLGVAYERVGEEAKAKEQFQLHDAIEREQAAEVQRQRKAVKQFLVVLPSPNRQQAQ